MVARRTIVSVFALLAPLIAFAQSTKDTPPPAVYTPTHRVQLPGNVRADGIAVSPDGSSVFVSGTASVVNVWAVLVSLWPEIGGTFVGLVLLLVLWRVRRIKQTPRLLGEPHCRSCNYCLKGNVTDRCPECGCSTQRRIIGRSVARRSVPYWALLTCVAAPYAALMAAQVPRNGAVSNRIEWWSSDLPDLALKLGTSMTGGSRPVGRIWELDVASGGIRRTLLTHSSMFDPSFEMSITPDGAHVVVKAISPGGMLVVGTRSGKVERTIESPRDGRGVWLGWTQVAGYSHDGKSMYAVFADPQDDKTQLFRCEISSGACERVLETGLDSMKYQSRSYPRARAIYVHDGAERILALEVETRETTSGECTLRLHGIGQSAPAQPMARSSVAIPSHAPGFSASGDRIVLRAVAGYFELDPAQFSSARPRVLRLPPGANATSFSVSADQPPGKLVTKLFIQPTITSIFTGAQTEVYAVYDLELDRWTAVCTTPKDAIYTEHAASRSCNAIVASGFLKGVKNATTFKPELLIYDLRQPPKPRAKVATQPDVK